MFPSEMVILMAIVETSGFGKKSLTHSMDITGEYIGYLCDSLVRRGYLEGNSSRGYQLTPKGRQSILDFLRENGARVKGGIKTLQQLRIEVSQEIDKLEKEATTVK